MDAIPTLSPGPPTRIPSAFSQADAVKQNEAAKFHFALKTIGLIPNMLPKGVVEQVRTSVIGLITDAGSGRYNVEHEGVQAIYALVQNGLERAKKEAEASKNPS